MYCVLYHVVLFPDVFICRCYILLYMFLYACSTFYCIEYVLNLDTVYHVHGHIYRNIHLSVFIQSKMSLKFPLCNLHLRYQARTDLVEIIDRFLVDYVDTGRFLEERPGHWALNKHGRMDDCFHQVFHH